MASEQEYGGTETNLQDKPASSLRRQPHPEGSEVAYERLTAYAFARRYVQGKAVADIILGRQEEGGAVGAGPLLLARSAESVEVLLGSGPPAAESKALASLAPNVVYREVELPKLPYSEGHFDVVVAFEVLEELEHPEELIKEAKRVLKGGGVLLLSSPDKQADANQGRGDGVGGRRGMYVGELRELVGRHFGSVRIYRQGAVAGGFIFPDTEETSSEEGATLSEVPLSVEVARFSLAETALARLEAQPPVTRSVIAVCCDAATLGQDEQPYVLLDRESGVFEEREDLAADVELMLGEVRRMEESEVQAFGEAMRTQRQQNLVQLRRHFLFYIRSYLGHRRNTAREDALHLQNVIRGSILHRRNAILEKVRHLRNLIFEDIIHHRNIIYGNIDALRKKGVEGSLRGALRRLSALYRRLAARKPD